MLSQEEGYPSEIEESASVNRVDLYPVKVEDEEEVNFCQGSPIFLITVEKGFLSPW